MLRSINRRIIYLLTCLIAISACTGTRPTHIGQLHNMPTPCPESPNCVSSLASDKHFIAPFQIKGNVESTWLLLNKTVAAYPRATIIESREDYLYAEFRSRLFRYVDDVEFFVNQEKNTVELRSASRLGYSDMGANRKRIEDIRRSLQQLNIVEKSETN